MRALIYTVLFIGAISLVEAQEKDPLFRFVSVSLLSEDGLLAPQNADVNHLLSPSLGIGLEMPIAEYQGWKINAQGNIEFTTNDLVFDGVDDLQSQSSSFRQAGVWMGATAIQNEWLSDTPLNGVSPFVSLEVGVVRADYHDPMNTKKDDTALGIRAKAGLDFTLSESASLRLAVGKNTFIDH